MANFVGRLLAQAEETGGYAQSEYLTAYGLVIGLILLGLLAVCVPRPRQKHFIEPEEVQQKNKSRRR